MTQVLNRICFSNLNYLHLDRYFCCNLFKLVLRSLVTGSHIARSKGWSKSRKYSMKNRNLVCSNRTKLAKFRSSYLASNMRSNSIPYKACYCETNVSASGRAYLKVLIACQSVNCTPKIAQLGLE